MIEDAIVLGAAIFLVLGFIYLLYKLNLVSNAGSVISIAMRSLEVMGDPLLDDDVKEAWMQKNAVSLFKLFALLLLGSITALLLPISAVWVLAYMEWLSFDAVIDLTLDWRFLLVTTVIGILIYKLNRRKETEQNASGLENRYSGMDRMLHSMAFALFPLQKLISKIEDSLNSKCLSMIADEPVFITGLPRSGTTLLLELLHGTSEFTSHTYRHMPFLAMPLTWGRFTSAFRTDDIAHERAHGDGMTVSLDSPEAFEEALWVNFFPDHYGNDSIQPWHAEDTGKFNRFMSNHHKKICLLHEKKIGASRGSVRYASKNNLNVARIEMILDNFPDSRVVLPFRDPYQHAASLLRQHRNFLKIHHDDKFARKYMADIGHFDFGDNLRPVNFNQWMDINEHRDPDSLAFWLNYWCAAYKHLLAINDDRVMLSDFDWLCANPESALRQLAGFIRLSNKADLLSQAGQVQPQRKHEVDTSSLPAELINRADSLYADLRTAAS